MSSLRLRNIILYMSMDSFLPLINLLALGLNLIIVALVVDYFLDSLFWSVRKMWQEKGLFVLQKAKMKFFVLSIPK